MNTLNNISSAILFLIPLGVICRVIFCFIKMMSEEDSETYKKKLINAIIFLIVSVVLIQLKDLIVNYYS